MGWLTLLDPHYRPIATIGDDRPRTREVQHDDGTDPHYVPEKFMRPRTQADDEAAWEVMKQYMGFGDGK